MAWLAAMDTKQKTFLFCPRKSALKPSILLSDSEQKKEEKSCWRKKTAKYIV
jgi:hypothetical protein